MRALTCIFFLGCCWGTLAPKVASAAQTPSSYWAYVGTYTGSRSKGIYFSQFDLRTGTLQKPELAAESVNPTFLAVHPNRKLLYAANEVGNFGGKKAGAVTAFAIEAKTGKLRPLNQQPSGGTGPCHVSLDATGKHVFVANYGGGSIAVLPVLANGHLGDATAVVQHRGSSVNRQRQEGPHAHHILTDPTGKFVLACDLGLDKVLVYRFESAAGSLSAVDPVSLSSGAGPRHLAFAPSGRHAYVINELNSTLVAFSWSADAGTLKPVQTVSTLPDGYQGQSTTAEVVVHPSGKFVFGSNRGHDSIAVFALDKTSGRMQFVEHQPTRGKTPRHFAIDPSGQWLLAENQGSDTIAVFRVDSDSGRLKPEGDPISVPSPVCVEFVPVNP